MPPRDTPAGRTARSVEEGIRHGAIEVGVLISHDGRERVRRRGSTGHVSIPQNDLLRYSPGATFTHNHPNGTGPSVEDVELAIEFQMAELRVVTARHRYVVRRLDGVKAHDVRAAFQAEVVKVERRLLDEVRRSLVHPTDFPAELVHRTWHAIAPSLRFEYRREP